MDKVDMLLEPVRIFLTEIGDFLPKLLLALGIVIIGWIVAKAVKFAATRTLRAVNFHIVTERAGIDQFLRQGGGDFNTTRLMGSLVFALVILVALMVAFNTLGLASVTDLTVQLLVFVAKLIVAIVIITFGAYFARFIGNAVMMYCRNAGIGDAHLLGRIAMYAVMMFIVLIALDQVGVGELLRHTFLILLAAIALALALAFGLGGQAQAAAFLRRLFGNETTTGVPNDRPAPPRGPRGPV
jgi:hypothetical protein